MKVFTSGELIAACTFLIQNRSGKRSDSLRKKEIISCYDVLFAPMADRFFSFYFKLVTVLRRSQK